MYPVPFVIVFFRPCVNKERGVVRPYFLRLWRRKYTAIIYTRHASFFTVSYRNDFRFSFAIGGGLVDDSPDYDIGDGRNDKG